MRVAKPILAVLALGALVLAGAWTAGWFFARPINHAVPPPDPPGRVVHLIASDGVRIEGSYWPGATEDGPAVLLLHGINASREMFDAHARWLNGLGYAVLAIDFRGQGGSDAVVRTFGWSETRDARAALDFLRRRHPDRRIGVIGVSMGGAAALMGEEGPLPVEAMVLQAVYPDLRTAVANRTNRAGSPALTFFAEPLLSYQSWPRYGVWPEVISPIGRLAHYRGEVLVIGGGSDLSTLPVDTVAMYRAAPGRKALWLVDGASHVETSKLWSEPYRHRVRCLFARTLGEPRPAPTPACG